MKIVFAGTPEFAVPALAALVAAGHEIVSVYTQPDRPAGRGRKLTASPVKQAALRFGIPVEQPLNFRADDVLQRLVRYSPDVMVVVAYGLLLPPSVLSVPRLGCVNIHASLLPRWRGAAPIQRAILAGDPQTGVCIMRMEAGLDTGPVYLEKRVAVASDDTGGSLHDRLALLGAEAIVEALSEIDADRIQARPQDAAGATYARKIEKNEASIDWTRSAAQIERQVRAFNPWPVAETRWKGQQLRIWRARALDEEAIPPTLHDRSLHCVASPNPGVVSSATNEGIIVGCGAGALAIQMLQLPGGKPVDAASFLNSNDVSGVRFG